MNHHVNHMNHISESRVTQQKHSHRASASAATDIMDLSEQMEWRTRKAYLYDENDIVLKNYRF